MPEATIVAGLALPTFRRIGVEPISGACGCENRGVDLARPLDPEALAEVMLAFEHFLVIVFRDQPLSAEQHKAFSRYFGGRRTAAPRPRVACDQERDAGLGHDARACLGPAFVVFYSLLGIPIAWLADRFSRRNIIAAGFAFWSLMTMLTGSAPACWARRWGRCWSASSMICSSRASARRRSATHS